MAGKPPGHLCQETKPVNIKDGTNCLSNVNKPGPSGHAGSSSLFQASTTAESPSLVESLRQQVVIGVVLGIRGGLSSVNPMGQDAVRKDEQAVYQLLAVGDYDKAFEVATGLTDYFEISREGKKYASPKSEVAAVMLGHATGFNQAVETYKGETASGGDLSGIDRIMTGLDALIRIASTAMTVAGGVSGLGLGKSVKVVSPVYRFAGRDVVVVESSLGRQAFYRSSGVNSGSAGQWFPVDEFLPGWFNKAAYTEGPGLTVGSPLHRLGSKEFLEISKGLGKMSIPRGAQVPAGTIEGAETTLNKILDFFGARITPTTVARPLP
jgi:hypothetical protein